MADEPAPKVCRRCGGDHELIACDYVKAVEFDHTGLIITRLEFLTPADYGPIKASSPDEPPAPRQDYVRLGEQERTGEQEDGARS